jgi:hypothetical protein
LQAASPKCWPDPGAGKAVDRQQVDIKALEERVSEAQTYGHASGLHSLNLAGCGP